MLDINGWISETRYSFNTKQNYYQIQHTHKKTSTIVQNILFSFSLFPMGLHMEKSIQYILNRSKSRCSTFSSEFICHFILYQNIIPQTDAHQRISLFLSHSHFYARIYSIQQFNIRNNFPEFSENVIPNVAFGCKPFECVCLTRYYRLDHYSNEDFIGENIFANGFLLSIPIKIDERHILMWTSFNNRRYKATTTITTRIFNEVLDFQETTIMNG